MMSSSVYRRGLGRAIGLSLVMAVAPDVIASPPPAPPSLRVAAVFSADDGAEAEARLLAGDVELRARLAIGAAAEAGFAASFPYVRVGATRPAGLAAFVYAPGSAAVHLLGRSGAPLILDGPRDAACLGASLGEDFGLFALAPLSGGEPETGRGAYGAWLSPRGGWLSALAMVAGAPGAAGGPSWYDAPSPPAERAFAAVSAMASGRAWAVAAAAAGSAGFPGPDAAAGRVEARASLGRLRLEAIGSAASASWTDPEGDSAPPLRLDSCLRYASRGFMSTIGYRYTVTDSAVSRYAAAVESVGRHGFARLAASLVPASGATEAVAELDARLRPGFAPWLTLSGSWRAVSGEATRLDGTASACFGGPVRVALDCGLRLSPEGRLVKGSAGVSRATAGGSIGCSVRSAGWIPEGDIGGESLEYSARATVTLK